MVRSTEQNRTSVTTPGAVLNNDARTSQELVTVSSQANNQNQTGTNGTVVDTQQVTFDPNIEEIVSPPGNENQNNQIMPDDNEIGSLSWNPQNSSGDLQQNQSRTSLSEAPNTTPSSSTEYTAAQVTTETGRNRVSQGVNITQDPLNYTLEVNGDRAYMNSLVERAKTSKNRSQLIFEDIQESELIEMQEESKKLWRCWFCGQESLFKNRADHCIRHGFDYCHDQAWGGGPLFSNRRVGGFGGCGRDKDKEMSGRRW